MPPAGAQRSRTSFKLLQVEGSDFYHNTANDYGSVTFKWFCGSGDPWTHFRGSEVQANFHNGRRGTGRYLLNAAAVDLMLAQLSELDASHPKKNN